MKKRPSRSSPSTSVAEVWRTSVITTSPVPDMLMSYEGCCAPPFVSTVNRSCIAWPWSQRYLAKMRRPLPDFSASLPSGLKIRSPKSARDDGTSSRMPSEPTPQLRSQILTIASVDSGAVRWRSSITR